MFFCLDESVYLI